MSTSGSTNFNLVANEIIEEAFDICGIGSEGETITAGQYVRARRSLNLLVKAGGAKDHLWLRTERDVTLTASTASYALTPKPARVLEVRRHNTASGSDTPLNEWSRQEYFDMPNKGSESIPTAFYYDPQRADGTLYLWPTPSAATASAYTLKLSYLRTIEDFDSSADDADLPQEWLLALSYSLAEQLALKYGVAPDIRQEIAVRASQYRAAIEAWDTEPASLHMQPEYR